MIFRLTAGYREREQVKALGARFNFQEKYWYYEGEELPEGLRRWYREPAGGNAVQTREAIARPQEAIAQQRENIVQTREAIARPQEAIAQQRENIVQTREDAARPQEAIAQQRENLAWPRGDGQQMDLTVAGDVNIQIERFPARTETAGAGHGRVLNFQTVTQVNRMISNQYKDLATFQNVLVKGEVTNYSGHNGNHYYFDIKDENCQLKCRLWEQVAKRVLRFELAKGQMVGLSGSLEYYEKDGASQLIVRDIMHLGAGDANLALLQLKNRLEAEGLFSPEHKKPIPAHPQKVGIITSKHGKAINDIRQKAAEKDPYVQLILYHVNVQGRNAVPSILRAIQVMDEMGVDTLIIGRGGGSDEELLLYNDEAIVRAVFAAKTPIISAVGHQDHAPLLDLVADQRVSTPTSAADMAIPNVMQDVRRLRNLQDEIKKGMRYQLERREGTLREQMAVLEQHHPERKLKEQKARLSAQRDQLRWQMESIYRERDQRFAVQREALERQLRQILQDKRRLLSGQQDRLHWNFQNVFSAKKHRFEVLVSQLNGLSPTAKLVKGFGYISVAGQPLVSVDGVGPGDEVLIRIHDGEVAAQVTEVKKNSN